jgi:cytochrome P450
VAVLDGLDIDPVTPGFFLRADYYELLAHLRAEAPVYSCAPGLKVVSRYEDIRTVGSDPERFISGSGVLANDPIREGGTLEGSLLHLDPPEHARWRKLLSRAFTARAITRVESWLHGLVRDMVDALPRETPIDLVESLTAPLPVAVICELLGVGTSDRGDFRRWSDAVIAASDGRAPMTDADLASAVEMVRFLNQLVADKALRPRDDLMSVLATAELDGRRLTTGALTTFAMSLVVAGNETTRHLMSGALIELARHPDQREAVYADATRISGAVEECLRWVTPIQQFARTARRDTEVAGVPVQEGDYLLMLYASGNRDEAAFGPTADRFDVLRRPSVAHLAFGFGAHFCLGAALARMEARVLLEELSSRRMTFSLAGAPDYRPSSLVRGPHSVPFVFD